MIDLNRYLLAQEHIIHRSHKHIAIFLNTFFWLMVTIGFYYHGDPLRSLAWAPAFATVVFGLQALIVYYTAEFTITNKRILIRQGLRDRHIYEICLANISHSNINQSLGGKIFNYGTINIQNVSGHQDPFFLVTAPITCQQQLQKELDKLSMSA